MKRLFGGRDRIRIAAGEPLAGERRWTSQVPGFAAHHSFVHPASGSWFTSDGWGVSFAALSFRRHDLATGAELARFRSGTAVRCQAILPGGTELLVATDKKLFRLAVDSLKEAERWDRRIPRYANSMAVVGDHVVVANWRDPRVSIVDLASGSIRPRKGPAVMIILARGSQPLLVGGSESGGVASIDPASGQVTTLVATPPAIDAALEPDGRALWLTVGLRAIDRPLSVGPGAPSRELCRQPLDGTEATTYDLPAGVRSVALGTSEIWLADRDILLAVPLPVGSAPARTWRPPQGQAIQDLDPDARLVIVSSHEPGGKTATMTAVAVS